MRKKIYTLFFTLFTAFLVLFLTSCQSKTTATLPYSFTLFHTTYPGNYEGQTSGNLPNGKGTFFSSEDFSPSFTVTGTWKNGLLSSKASILYSDGSSLSAKFVDNSIEGTVTFTNADKTYQKYKCSSGEPYDLITTYSENGDILSYDWFYQSIPISTLKETAIAANYSELLYKPVSFYGEPLRVSGTIQKIYDTPSKSYCILTDKENHSYILAYKNTMPAKFSQARTMNFLPGDQITAYGYITTSFKIPENSLAISHLAIENIPSAGSLWNSPTDFLSNGKTFVSNDADDSDNLEKSSSDSSDNSNEKQKDLEKEQQSVIIETSCPYLTLITAELDNPHLEFDRSNPSYTYEDINRFPYFYSGLKHTFTGKIVKLITNYEKDRVEMLISENNMENIYYCTYYYSTKDTHPVVGDSVTVTGILKGNYKASLTVSGNNTYILYPRLRASEITIK